MARGPSAREEKQDLIQTNFFPVAGRDTPANPGRSAYQDLSSFPPSLCHPPRGGSRNMPSLGAGGLPLTSPGSLSSPNLHLLTMKWEWHEAGVKEKAFSEG